METQSLIFPLDPRLRASLTLLLPTIHQKGSEAAQDTHQENCLAVRPREKSENVREQQLSGDC